MYPLYRDSFVPCISITGHYRKGDERGVYIPNSQLANDGRDVHTLHESSCSPNHIRNTDTYIVHVRVCVCVTVCGGDCV